jgi:hypothetical protein
MRRSGVCTPRREPSEATVAVREYQVSVRPLGRIRSDAAAPVPRLLSPADRMSLRWDAPGSTPGMRAGLFVFYRSNKSGARSSAGITRGCRTTTRGSGASICDGTIRVQAAQLSEDGLSAHLSDSRTRKEHSPPGLSVPRSAATAARTSSSVGSCPRPAGARGRACPRASMAPYKRRPRPRSRDCRGCRLGHLARAPSIDRPRSSFAATSDAPVRRHGLPTGGAASRRPCGQRPIGPAGCERCRR